MEAKGCADALVVSIHQGVEYSAYTDRASRKLAKAVVEAGADIVVCHHSHVVQAYERVKNSLVFYGLGNFLLDINECWRPAAASTLALRMELEGGKIRKVKIEPVVLNEEWQPSMADLDSELAIRTKVERLSLLLQTRFGRTINDLAAFHTWTRLHFRALWGMVRREGISKTTRYYRGRVKEKLSPFWD
jgi:poly-gamma-glutamate capsule biosynthesis protein CapA/YwtB (metallophosphatase superfamily)